MSKKTVYHSEQEAETGFNRAIQAYINRGDEDLAQEVADAGLDAWLEASGRRIENPAPSTLALVNPISKRSRATMPRAKSVATLEAEIENLRNDNLELQESLDLTETALDEANSRLAQIYDLSGEEIDPEDFSEDSDLEDEESEEGSDEDNGRD
jgi:hypothetical protein